MSGVSRGCVKEQLRENTPAYIPRFFTTPKNALALIYRQSKNFITRTFSGFAYESETFTMREVNCHFSSEFAKTAKRDESALTL